MTEKISKKMDDINSKLDELQRDMKEIWCLLDEMKSDLSKVNKKLYSKKSVKNKNSIVAVDDRTRWKKHVYEQIKPLTSEKSLFKKRSEVLHYIYNYMRRNYGIVWEQDIKEYQRCFELDYKPKTIDVVYNNKMYRSIFEAVLFDMIANTQNKFEHSLLV